MKRRYGMWNSWRVDQEGNKIWSVRQRERERKREREREREREKRERNK